jgi:hypothetical protein
MASDLGPVLFGARQVEFAKGMVDTFGDAYDAIVSPGESYISGTGTQAFLRKPPILYEWSERTGSHEVLSDASDWQVGDVYANPLGNGKPRWCLHAVTVDDAPLKIITETLDMETAPVLVRNLLATAEKLKCTSIVIPPLGTREAELPPDAFVEAFASAVCRWAAGPSSLVRVCFLVPPEEADLLSMARQQIAGIVGCEALVSYLPVPFAELGQRWLGMSSLEPQRRFHETVSLLRKTLEVGVDHLGLGSECGRMSNDELAVRLTGSFGDELVSILREIWTLCDGLAPQGERTPDPLSTGLLPKREPDSESAGLVPVNIALFKLLARLASKAGIGLPAQGNTTVQSVNEERTEPSGAPDSTVLCFIGEGTETVSPGVPIPAEKPQGTGPLRQLRDFVDQALSKKARQRLFERLDREKYEGPDHLRLLEFLIRVGDPAEWIANEFPYHVLQNALRDRGVMAESDNRNDLTFLLLGSMGFPVVSQRFHGIEEVIRELENIRSEMLDPYAPFDGGVGRGAIWLEYICKVLIRFLCQVAYGQGPDSFFHNAEKLTAKEKVGGCTLGKLFELLQYLNELIEQDTENLSVQRFKSVLKRPAPLPKDLQRLAAVRNCFLHYQDNSNTSESIKLERAQKFINEALEFAKAVNGAGAGLFPIILRVDNINIDSWGRRKVVAYRTDGRREIIFTDEELEAGHIYFMHPTTNPLRVDPVLVPARKLWDG